MSNITENTKKRVYEAYQLNPNKTAIAKQFGISPRSVGRYLELFEGTTEVNLELPLDEPEEAVEEASEPVEQSTPKYLITNSQVSIETADGMMTLGVGHRNYSAIREAIIKGDFETAINMIDVPKAIEKYSHGLIKVEGDKLFYAGHQIRNRLVDVILRDLSQGKVPNSAINFLEKLMYNPSKQSVDELWGFLEACDLPITEDGYFLAYKKVRDDYLDCHSATIDNSVGQVVEMPRNLVNDNRSQTCSSGLHFCSQYYLDNFGGDRLMAVKIDPADVVSIPTDYNDSKGRCCKYTVIAELNYPDEIFELV